MRSASKDALSAVLSTEGRVVGSCWEELKPQGQGLPGRAQVVSLQKVRLELLRARTSFTMGYHYVIWALSRLAGPGVCERVLPWNNSYPFEDYPLAGSAAILCTGGPDVI